MKWVGGREGDEFKYGTEGVPPWNNWLCYIFIIFKPIINMKKPSSLVFLFLPLEYKGVRKVSYDRSSFGTYDRTTKSVCILVSLLHFRLIILLQIFISLPGVVLLFRLCEHWISQNVVVSGVYQVCCSLMKLYKT